MFDNQSGRPPGAQRKVPVMDAILPLYAQVLGQPGLLLRLTGMLLVILVAMDIAFQQYIFQFTPAALQAQMQQGDATLWLLLFAQLVVTVWVSTMYAVRWHRYMLLGHEEYGFADVAPRGRDWRYFGMGLLVGLLIGLAFALLSTLAAAALGQVNIPVIIGLGLLIAYVCARICLIFPGIAIDSGLTLNDSWRYTEGNGLRIVLLFIVMTLPVGLLAQAVSGFVPLSIPSLPLVSALIQSIVINVFFLINVALGQSALSHAYKHLVPK
jgi:hypothetical protein